MISISHQHTQNQQQQQQQKCVALRGRITLMCQVFSIVTWLCVLLCWVRASTSSCVVFRLKWAIWGCTYLHAGSPTSLKKTHVPPFKQNAFPITGHDEPELVQCIDEDGCPANVEIKNKKKTNSQLVIKKVRNDSFCFVSILRKFGKTTPLDKFIEQKCTILKICQQNLVFQLLFTLNPFIILWVFFGHV